MGNKKRMMVKIIRHSLTAAFFVLLFFVGVRSQDQQTLATQSPQAEPLSLTEAEVLVYLLPRAREVRRQGGRIGWEVETGPSQNTTDFYNFWVVDNKQQGHIGSVTLGYFSVNKHTADVWDQVSDKVISPDEELQGIQKILRDGHHINAQTLEKYRDVNP